MARTPLVTPLVLVPGLLCDALQWQPQIAGLSDIADCWVAGVASSDTMAGIAADVLAACPFPEFALAGLSMGGYVALEIMRQAPLRITALALLDTTARPDTQDQIARRLAFIELAERGRFAGVSDALIPFLIHPDRVAEPALTGIIKTMARNIGKTAFIRQQRAIMSRMDSRPLLAQIACPALVLCGREDKITPPDRHEEMAAAMPRAELVIVAHCGHLSTLERSDAVNARMRRLLEPR